MCESLRCEWLFFGAAEFKFRAGEKNHDYSTILSVFGQ